MNCANCNAELKLVFDSPKRRHDDFTTQYERALAVTIGGGYGMFFDEIETSPRDMTVILCHDCAHAFARENPWVQGLLMSVVGRFIPADRTADELGHMHEGTDFGRKGHGHA